MRCLLLGLSWLLGAVLGGSVGVWIALPVVGRGLEEERHSPGLAIPVALFAAPVELLLALLVGALIGGVAFAALASFLYAWWRDRHGV